MQAELRGLYDFLVALTVMDGRFYHMEAPQNSQTPYARFAVVTNLVERDFGEEGGMSGVDVKDFTVQIDLFGRREDGADNLGEQADLLFAALQGATFDITGHDRGVLTCVTQGLPTIEDELVRVLTEWRVRGAAFP